MYNGLRVPHAVYVLRFSWKYFIFLSLGITPLILFVAFGAINEDFHPFLVQRGIPVTVLNVKFIGCALDSALH